MTWYVKFKSSKVDVSDRLTSLDGKKVSKSWWLIKGSSRITSKLWRDENRRKREKTSNSNQILPQTNSEKQTDYEKYLINEENKRAKNTWNCQLQW